MASNKKSLKQFWRCYDPADYNKIVEEFQVFLKYTSDKINLVEFVLSLMTFLYLSVVRARCCIKS